MMQLIDSSGIRLWYTPILRPYDASVTIIGHRTSSVFKIPAQNPSYWLRSWCPSECTKSNLPADGIKIIGAALHTHTAGVSVKVQLYRNGTELPPPADEPYYDFNYQDYVLFDPELVLLPSDELQISCRYDTTYRTAETQLGLSTSEEMCLIYFVYYPAMSKMNESCSYGDYTTLQNPSYSNKTVFCSPGYNIQNFVPRTYDPYIPPPCVYVPPPANRTTPILSNAPINPADYERSQYLDADQKYKLYWSIDKVNMAFNGAVEVQTPGWVGLGISEFGMEGADVFIGWVKDGVVNFADRFATRKALPPVDTLQDFYDIKGGEVVPAEASGLTTRQIAGIGAAVGAAFVALVLTAIYCIRKKQKSKYRYLVEEEEDTNLVGVESSNHHRAPVPL